MTDESSFFNELRKEQELDDALFQIERAIGRFEDLLGRHAKNLQTIQHPDNLSIFEPITGKNPAYTQKLPQNLPKNRFPATSGQLFADLAAALSRLAGRNL